MLDRKLRRSAAALGDQGRDVLEWLDQPDQRAALVRAAQDGLPSVAGISSAFVAKFGKDAGKTMVIRQFVGRAVRHVMADEGFAPIDTGVKLSGDPVFRSGTRYQQENVTEKSGATPELLYRLLSALSVTELRQVERFLQQRRRHTESQEVAG